MDLRQRQPVVTAEAASGFAASAAPEAASGFAASAAPEAAAGFAASAAPEAASSSDITATVGNPQPQHIEYARQLRVSIPELLYDAAHSPELSLLLVVALALEDGATRAERQLQLVDDQMGEARAGIIRKLKQQLSEVGPEIRLPLLEIAFPMLKNRPAPQLEFLLDLVRKLTEMDGQQSFREYCLLRVLSSQLRRSASPAAKSANRVSRRRAREAAIKLIRIVADQGSRDPQARAAAFRAGNAYFGKWGSDYDAGEVSEWSAEELDECLDILQQINIAGRQSLLQAVSKTVSQDGHLTLDEARLLRAICATLELPLPPILGVAGKIQPQP